MRRLLHAQTRELPDGAHVPAVVTRLIDGRLQDESASGKSGGTASAEPRMRKDAAKRFEADLAAPDVFVPIHARAQRRLRVIDVHDGHAPEPYGAIEVDGGLREACRSVNLV